jgi:Na+/glutamate symporter
MRLTPRALAIAAGGLVVAIVIGFWAFTRWDVAKPQGDEESAEKSTQVQLAAVENKAITEAVSTFGTVVPQAGKIVSINVPVETVVRYVMVTRGQSLHAWRPADPDQRQPGYSTSGCEGGLK